MKKLRVGAVTLGCKLNYAETASILDRFAGEGWELAEKDDMADLFIIHTCAVTGQAEQKSRQLIRKIIRTNPGCRVVVTGCYAQLDPERLASIDGVSVVLGTEEKHETANYTELSDVVNKVSVKVSGIARPSTPGPASSLLSSPERGRTRAFLKIQDGCSHVCAYCTIPAARGPSRSVPLLSLLERARALARAGYREIVLTGVNIADYRDGGNGFVQLLQQLERIDVCRIRTGSIEPDLLSAELIRTMAVSEKIMPHFHLPLQSGSDAILRAMGRRYDTATYRARCMEAVAAIPGCGIGVDVMTGYPGELEQDFEAMYHFLEELPVAYLHVFTCSVRPNTLLARQVAENERKPVPYREMASRAAQLSTLGSEKERRFADSFIGSRMRVLFEEKEKLPDGDEQWVGYSANYLRVGTRIDADCESGSLRGEERTVLVEEPGEGWHLRGRLVF